MNQGGRKKDTKANRKNQNDKSPSTAKNWQKSQKKKNRIEAQNMPFLNSTLF